MYSYVVGAINNRTMQESTKALRIRALSECVWGCAVILINQMKALRRGNDVSWEEIQKAIDGLQHDTSRLREMVEERAKDRQV